MPHPTAQNNEHHFAITRSAPRYRQQREKKRRSLELEANDALQTLARDIVDEDGKPATPEIARWQRGDGKPFSISLGYVVRAAMHGGRREPWLRIGHYFLWFVNAVFDRYERRRAA